MRRPSRSRPFTIIPIAIAVLTTIVSTPAFAISDNPDETWMTNGQIRAMVRHGKYLYIGGKFSQVRDSTNPGPRGKFSAMNLARINVSTGRGDRSWTPNVVASTSDPAVHALTVARGKVWVGGDFRSVGGRRRHNLAAVTIASGKVVPGVKPVMGDNHGRSVRALVRMGRRVFAGGYFSHVGGSRRGFLAAFDFRGRLEKWKPVVNRRVFSLAPSCDERTLFVGGQFRRARGKGDRRWIGRETVAAFDPQSGALRTWHVPSGSVETGQKAYAMAPTCRQLNVAYGGRNRAMAFRLDDGTRGAVKWQKSTSGNVQAVAVADGRVVIGGHFTSIGPITRNRIAALNMATGSVVPGFNPSITGQWGGPWALQTDRRHLYVGGQFTRVGSEPRTFLARFRL
jgi:PQQ-like domain